MQRAYVAYKKAAVFYFFLRGPQGFYGYAPPATGQEGSLTAYYAIDGGSSVSTGTTVEEVNGSTNAGVYSVTCTDVVTEGYHIVMSLYHSTSTYWAEPLAIATDTLYPPGMNVGEISGDSAAAANMEKYFDGTGYGIQAASALTTVSLPSGGITAATIAADAITAAKIADDSITADQVADGTITAAKIGADAITAAKIADDSITADQVADGTITAAKIAADAITAAKIADDSITADQVADGTITAAKIAADAITAAKIADDSITADQVADDTITAAKIADGAITAAKIPATVNADIVQVDGSTTGVSGLQQAVSTVVEAEVAASGSSSTLIVSDTAALSSTDDAYVRRNLTFTSGALINQASVISDYAGSSKTITVSVAFTGTPAEDDTFIIS